MSGPAAIPPEATEAGACTCPPVCAAMSRPLIPGKPGSYQICTRDQGHKGNHTSCDGHGHILASWLRMPVERYWRQPDCEGHDHG